ncbi:extracellular solute-binding protein [Paenibacillus nasutitermitis]|uniref:ABC transporter substrate-binding protein n=1 Tax=Paenibacillus nasutitermitis TaxID=1652958 RepID=A0A916ZGA5_9BACL|nr:extracellular solute-binding protein [Paenibacillus nasutitermitis]GGD93757.1 hypothetical protein GCM10010911_60520 [Paenibacillus nasutitermitis]
MRRWMLVLILVMTFSVIAACSNSSKEPGESQGVTKTTGTTETAETAESAETKDIAGVVRVALAGWPLENGIDPVTGKSTVGLSQYLKETFEKQYPNIKLEVTQVPWENALAKQNSMLISKDVDILYTAGGWSANFHQQGLTRSIDDLVEKDTAFDKSMYPQGIWDGSYSIVSADGQSHIGLPSVLGQRMPIMDNKIFEDWGVEPLSASPTPEEILEKALKMTGKNPKTGEENYGLWFSGNDASASTFFALAYAYGAGGGEGTVDKAKDIKWELNTPEMVKVFEWMAKAAAIPPTAFVNGQGSETFGLEDNDIAISLNSNGYTMMSAFAETKDQALLERYEPVLQKGFVAIDPIVMAKQPKDLEASWEVMKFLAGYETQKHMYENFQYTPVVVNADFVSQEDKYTRKALEIAEVTSEIFLTKGTPFLYSDIIPAVNNFISDIRNGKSVDIQKYLDDLQKRAVDWSANQ